MAIGARMLIAAVLLGVFFGAAVYFLFLAPQQPGQQTPPNQGLPQSMPAQQPQNQSVQTPQNQSAQQTQNQSGQQPSADALAREEFEKLVRATPPDFRAEYNKYETLGGRTETTVKAIQYYKGGKYRLDRVQAAANAAETSEYWMDGYYYKCTKSNAGAWGCTQTKNKFEEAGPKAMPLRNMRADWNYTVANYGAALIAGMSAKCFRAFFKPCSLCNPVESIYCFSNESVILLATWGESDEIVATSYSASVQDSDFVLPATPANGT